MATGDSALTAFRDFVQRVGALDAPAEADQVAVVTVSVGTESVRLSLSASVVRALDQALRAYHDPRDRGECGRCGGRRLDDNFLCRDCGRPNGVFGQMLHERAARFGGDPFPPGTGRTASP